MKYIREEQEDKILLSTYLKDLEGVIEGIHIPQDEYDYSYLEYMMSLFGDIELERSLVQEFVRLFSRFGGRYSVMSSPDTLKGLLDMKRKYPYLSTEAIGDLGIYYIKDLFDEYSLDTVLKDFFDTYGREDIAFTKYLEFVDKMAEEYQKKFDREAEEVGYLEDEYGIRLVEYIQARIKRSHESKDKILECLPEVELIKRDEEELHAFAVRSRIHFSICYPKSYELIIAMTKDSELTDYAEQYSYRSSFGKEVKVPFTKTEFIESVKRRKGKKLEKTL